MFKFIFRCYHRLVWIGKDLKDYLVQPLTMGREYSFVL